MKYLPPLILKESWWTPIEQTINDIFERMIFAPLRAALLEGDIEIANARPVGLERALSTGEVYYDDGRIYGRFNASISKELKGMGATFDKRSSSWKLPAGAALPARLQMAIAHHQDKTDKAIGAVVRALDGIDLNADVDIDELKQQYGTGAWRINEDFVAAARAIAIVPEFTEATKDTIATQWANNLDLYIKGWAKEAIVDLRGEVQSNTLRGQRSANLVKMIQSKHAVSKNKAKFLARQETSLLMSKMRENRYKDIGITHYRWSTSHDSRVRPANGESSYDGDHRVLDGKVFSWDNPPITCQRTGARNHPGEDFNCRCVAVAILEDAA